jgi:ABC-type branched-subunit amino acid transport system ATPase component
MPLLEVDGVVARYADVDILQGVCLRVEAGSLVTLLGPNGAGKSTLLKAIIGLLRPRAGRVRFDGRDTTDTPPEVHVATGMGYVPQVANVFPSLTVLENLEVSLPLGGDRGRIGEALEWFPVLREKLRLRAGVLSGGERQMLAIGRALVTRPKLLLLDEPTAALAPGMARGIMDRILRIREAGTAVLMVEQNARLALTVADRGYVLEMGRNALDGTGQGLLDDPRVRDLYLGGGTGWADAGN